MKLILHRLPRPAPRSITELRNGMAPSPRWPKSAECSPVLIRWPQAAKAKDSAVQMSSPCDERPGSGGRLSGYKPKPTS
jgi:hypothetical protein